MTSNAECYRGSLDVGGRTQAGWGSSFIGDKRGELVAGIFFLTDQRMS